MHTMILYILHFLSLCIDFSVSGIPGSYIYLLSDFINLTQVHNFTVSAQDIFTFCGLSVFTVNFTGILQLLMQIMKR